MNNLDQEQAKRGAQKEANETLLRKHKVLERTGLPSSTLYYYISRKEFPPPVKLGARSVAWKRSEIEEWINTRERSLVGESYDISCPSKIGSKNNESRNETQLNSTSKG